jgi:hypothetical protein
MIQQKSLNGEIKKTTYIIQRDCHLPIWHVEVAGVCMPFLYKSGEQLVI